MPAAVARRLGRGAAAAAAVGAAARFFLIVRPSSVEDVDDVDDVDTDESDEELSSWSRLVFSYVWGDI